MKQLTQAVFEGQPDWVQSAAVCIDGRAIGFSCREDQICPHGKRNSWIPIAGVEYRAVNLGAGFDATNWDESSISREQPQSIV